jgi:pyrophosphatase PpaX
MIKALLCDFDGTIANTVPCVVAAYDKTLRKFGFTFSTPEIVNKCLGRSEENICDNLGIQEKIEAFKRTYLTIVLDLVSNAQLFPDAIKTLGYARNKNIKLGIITFGHRNGLMVQLNRLGITEYFQSIVCFDDVEYPKPNPESVIISCKNLQVKLDRALVIGDGEGDILMGKNAGTKTALFLPKEHISIYNFEKLKQTNPDYIVTNWQQLEEII